MGRKKATSQIFASTHSFSGPVALTREIVKDQQVRFDEETIVWGENDALPMIIFHAINQSPTTMSCLGKVTDFMQGSGFTDKTLMQMPVDTDGTTLWELHQKICEYMTKLEGFSTRFMFNGEGAITQAMVMPIENLRFVKPQITQSRKIRKIKYNPYWGTDLMTPNDSDSYNVWNPSQEQRYAEIIALKDEKERAEYKGQIYFYGNPRSPYKFYPVPKYWSGKEWIYVDGQCQIFNKKMLDDGFFQSVMIKMIGDPTQPSKNPKYQKNNLGTDNTTRKEWDGTTVGEEFSENMSKNFSGVEKAGKAMVTWSQNKDTAATIEAFPNNANFENLDGTQIMAIRGIAIATEVQAILANLPQQGSSLGSDGDSMRMAVELMQARVKEPQITLEQFYNTVLLPNMAEKTGARVKIIQHQPISNQIQVPDKVWEWMNDKEKADFVRAHIPTVTVDVSRETQPAAAPVAPQTPNGTETAQSTPQVNEALKGLNLRDISKFTKIAQRMARGEINREQAAQILKGYGLDDEQIKAWLPEEAIV